MLLIMIGSSGSGKSTILNKLNQKNNLKFKKEITTTTREIRIKDNEKEGIDYYYLTKEEFLRKKNNNEFIETDKIGEEYYGTDKKILENIEKENKSIILTSNGAIKLQEYCKKNNIEVKTILLILPKEKIKERLEKRGDKKEAIEKRLKSDNIAKEAIEKYKDKKLKINLILQVENLLPNQILEEIKKVITKKEKKEKKIYKKIYNKIKN